MDNINHPDHYKAGGIETIDFIEAKELNYNLGNAVKYISRAGKKDHETYTTDLEKAIWYLRREVNKIHGELKKKEYTQIKCIDCGHMEVRDPDISDGLRCPECGSGLYFPIGGTLCSKLNSYQMP